MTRTAILYPKRVSRRVSTLLRSPSPGKSERTTSESDNEIRNKDYDPWPHDLSEQEHRRQRQRKNDSWNEESIHVRPASPRGGKPPLAAPPSSQSLSKAFSMSMFLT